MSQAIGLFEGQSITHPIGRVTVVVTCLRPGYAYRSAVHHGGTAGMLGAEIPELSRSWPTEIEARQAARRAVVAFRSVPQGLPFPVVVEQALAHLAVQLDEAIRKALSGGDGTGRQALPLARLTKAREALRTPAERIAEDELVARLVADLEAYDTEARYRAAMDEADERPAPGPLAERVRDWQRHNRNRALIAADRDAELRPARSWAEIRERHQAALRRDRESVQ